MSPLLRLIQGLTIFAPDGIFGLDHNEVAITTNRDLSEQEKETLCGLGWVYCDTYNTWGFIFPERPSSDLEITDDQGNKIL